MCGNGSGIGCNLTPYSWFVAVLAKEGHCAERQTGKPEDSWKHISSLNIKY